jgi:hypothetical protein
MSGGRVWDSRSVLFVGDRAKRSNLDESNTNVRDSIINHRRLVGTPNPFLERASLELYLLWGQGGFRTAETSGTAVLLTVCVSPGGKGKTALPTQKNHTNSCVDLLVHPDSCLCRVAGRDFMQTEAIRFSYRRPVHFGFRLCAGMRLATLRAAG